MNILPRLLLILSLLCSFAVVNGFSQLTAKSVRDQGIALYDAGKYEEALMKFTMLLQQNPRDPYARSYLAKCKLALQSNLTSNDLEGKLSKLVLPQVNFVDAPIGDVLDFLANRAEELSGGKTVVNFIYKGTAEQRQKTTITLSVRNVPITEAIRYVGQLSRSHIRYEEHAVVVDPNYSSSTTFSKAEKEAQQANRPNPFIPTTPVESAGDVFK